MSNIEEKEKRLIEAGEKLGRIMAKVSDEKKKVLQRIKRTVEEFAKDMESKGRFIDRSSMYAMGIIIDDELNADDELAEAAKEYIEADHQYLQALKEAGKK